MKILIISDEVWNDQIHGNNILSNWFQDFDAEFANLYLSPGNPKNDVCVRYFQITDRMVIDSIFGSRKLAGMSFDLTNSEEAYGNIDSNSDRPKKIYEIMRFARDILWYFGRYDSKKLRQFIINFNPDIIFSPRLATIKILKIEKLIHSITKKPFIAFTGDAEYTLRKFRLSPIFWIRKLIMRKMFRSNMKFYAKYYLFSKQQMREYENEFGNKFKILHKGYSINDQSQSIVSDTGGLSLPIRIIYAGKLYSNRWRTLFNVAKIINKINNQNIQYEFHIYSRDSFSYNIKKVISKYRGVYIHKAVEAYELNKIIKSFDIALHIESFDISNRLLTRLSISTKIVDYLASGCAIMAIAWEKHSALQYLEENDAAIIIKEKKLIEKKLKDLLSKRSIVSEYKYKANDLLIKNHNIYQIRRQLLSDFNNIIKGGDNFEGSSD